MNVSADSVQIAGPNALGPCALNVTGGTLQLGGNSPSIGSLSGSGTAGRIQNGAATNATMTAGTNNANTSFGGTIADGGAGRLALIKVGSGTLALIGSNTYTGLTTINQGELLVNGSLASPHTDVNSGGVLAGTGSMAAVTVNAGGHLSPGSPLGALQFSGSLGLLSGAVMDYELDTPLDSDLVKIPTSLLLLSGQQFSDFNFTPLGGFGAGTYPLVQANSIFGSLGGNTTGTIDGLSANLAIQGNNLVLTVVPEPGTLAMLFVGIGLIFLLQPRRSRTRISPQKRMRCKDGKMGKYVRASAGCHGN
jgi:autotransporter-associated beta strand protein